MTRAHSARYAEVWTVSAPVDGPGRTGLMRPATIGMVNAFSAIAAVWPMPCPQSVETNAAVPNRSHSTLVPRSLRPFSRVLRASFLVLLLLGLMARPAPGLGCDLLANDHGSEVTATSDQA